MTPLLRDPLRVVSVALLALAAFGVDLVLLPGLGSEPTVYSVPILVAAIVLRPRWVASVAVLVLALHFLAAAFEREPLVDVRAEVTAIALVGALAFFLALTRSRLREAKDRETTIAAEQRREMAQRQQLTELVRESETRYRNLIEQIPAVVYLTAVNGVGRTTYVSPPIEVMTGFSPEEWLVDSELWAQRLHPEDHERTTAEANRCFGKGEPFHAEYRLLTRDGEVRWVSDQAVLVDDRAGNRLYQGIMLDITDRKRAEAALVEANENLRKSIEELQSRGGEITLLGEMVDLLQACQSTDDAYGVIAQFARRLFPRESGALYVTNTAPHPVDAVARWGDTPPQEESFRPIDCWALRRGRMHLVEDSATGLVCHTLRTPVPASYLCVPLVAQGQTLGVLHLRSRPDGSSEGPVSTELMTEAKQRVATAVAEHAALALANLQLQETLRAQAIRDPLTGLLNRRYLEEALDHELSRAARRNATFGVVMVDIDHFKRLNDTFGHAAGDTVLRELGTLLQARFRGEDIVCRYGGEELLIILPDASLNAALQRAVKLRDEIRQIEIRHQGQVLPPVTISLGVAAFPQHGKSVETLLRAADVALYRAKDEGRDRVVVAE